jgi:zinc D-Ala-D-Ala dipeptidase
MHRLIAILSLAFFLLGCQTVPPRETGQFRETDLVEIIKLDPTIRLDVRYATTNNFLHRAVYSQARAFLQRPAAEALVRAHQKLKPKGYGILVFDGYRPWSVTKIFWDSASEAERKIEFVANPKKGSRHNRGCAADISLFELATGKEVPMPSGYDEFSERANPNYAGGSAESRALRDMLRAAMESEGFTVYPEEWWHFDFNDWRQYRILNVPLEAIRQPLHISWTNNLLTVTGADLPGGKLEIWYLEAFCRTGAHERDWRQTTLPHKTTLLTNENNRVLRFHTKVQPDIEVNHVVTAGDDELDIRFTMMNRGQENVDVQWFQPACIRVEKFTGCVQSNYTAKSFIFTDRALTTLDRTRRTEDALYRGGQVYIMPGVEARDANPRPLCLDRPTNGLIGCFSADGKQLLATASDQTHELFEGVYVCLHSDPLIGGLKAGGTKTIHAKLYVMTNDIPALLKRYAKDFPAR